MEAKQQSFLIPEERIIAPLSVVLNETIPKVINGQVNPSTTPLRQSLDELFPEQKIEEKKLQEAKKILGTLSYELTPAQLNEAIIEIEFLSESWLNDFERSIFNGLTLQELLHEKGGR
ncbi:MAG TPA: hypothetical protein VES68_01600 [Candidatus Sulfotelmatobacter sp.]|nr:hypothetical protein [Candidatus Sulfotelmatobacter sp.]